MTADIQQENSIWRKVLLLAADKFDQMSGPDALGENNQHAGGRRFFCLSPFSLFLQFFFRGWKVHASIVTHNSQHSANIYCS